MNAISSWDEISALRQRRGGGGVLGAQPDRAALMEATVAASLEISESVTITFADRSPNAGEDQTARPPALPELPKA